MNEEKETIVLVTGEAPSGIAERLKALGFLVKTLPAGSHIESHKGDLIIVDDGYGKDLEGIKAQAQLYESLVEAGEFQVGFPDQKGYQRGKGKRKKKWESPYG